MSVQEKPCATTDREDAKATFIALAREYRFSEDIAKAMYEDLEFRSLADFRYSVTKEDEIKTVILARCGEAGSKTIEQARVRRAWWAVCSALNVDGPKEAPLEELLSARELADFRETFWTRHRSFLPPERSPSDRLLSRLKRELDKKSLTVFPLNQVSTQAQQRATRKVRRRLSAADPESSVGVALYAEQEETDDSLEVALLREDTLSGYMELLMVYLQGLAMVGCTHRDDRPSDAEGARSDPLKYVSIPLSVLEEYWWRARLAADRYPDLAWVRQQDVMERQAWVQEYHNPSAEGTLGEIIRRVFVARSAHWDTSTLAKPSAPKKSDPQPSARGSRGDAAEPPKAGALSTSLRDGTELCSAFNSKKGCAKKGCRQVHRCGYTLPSGRVCGSWGHAYDKCPEHKKR